MHEDTSANDARARRGMDRRTMIKAAGIAGLGAWTAPMIVDSMASPVAAESCGATTPTGTATFTLNTNSGVKTYTTGGGQTSVFVSLWGAGGRGGTGGAANFTGGGGGGGGAFYGTTISGLTPCTTYTYTLTVGRGGTNTGGLESGGFSRVVWSSPSVTLTANGGNGVVGASTTGATGGAAGATGPGITTFKGGDGGTGATNNGQPGGGSAGSGSAATGQSPGNSDGTHGAGASGAAGGASNAVGNPGITPGSGGGGGGKGGSFSGGNGADGKVVISPS